MKTSGKCLFLLTALIATLDLMAACQTADGQGLQAQIPAAEYTALSQFYTDTHGGTWFTNTSWLNPAATSWYGVTVAGGHVTEIALSHNNLSNNFASSLTDFSKLTALDLSSNHLSGLIPSNLGRLTNLADLNLSSNAFDETIPSELGSVPQLQELNLSDNKLTGGIPVALTNLAQLRLLDLHGNELTGTIPVRLSNLAVLTNLDLHSNKITGAIPTNVDALRQLQSLNLSQNSLGGNIPTNVGNLSQLQVLRLYSDELTGSIPTNLVNLVQLQKLDLAANSLTDGIPTNLAGLSNLQELDLSSNQLAGSIPTNLGNLVQLQVLRLSLDQLSNGIPTNFSSLSQLQTLDASSNQLSGGIPTNLDALTQLQELDLGGNPLGGSIPTNLTSLTQLRALLLYDDELIGSIPTNLGALIELQDLDLGDNQLTNGIPTSLGSLTQLTNIDLSVNELSGSVPTNLGGLTNVQNLALDYNQLSNGIPASLGSLVRLANLDLSGNLLTGDIPTGLGNLILLTNLNLFANQLSGSIPSDLSALSDLRALNLSSNGLSGSIPPDLGNLSELTDLELAGNQLSGSIPFTLGYLYQLKDLELQSNQLSGDVPYWIAFTDVFINISYNDLNVAAGSESLADIDAMNSAGNTVVSLPQLDLSIIVQPLNELAPVGGTATFTVSATGAPPLYYQWQFNGANISGATGSSYAIDPVATGNMGIYSVIISNAYNVITSEDAVLDIETSGVSHPSITITSPGSGGHTSIGVEGTVRDSRFPVESVFYTLSNINERATVSEGQAILTAGARGASNWFVTNGILPGTNFISVQAIDTASNRSSLVKRRFLYDVAAPLSIITQGTGTGTFALHSFIGNETPLTNSLNIGQTYKITARPAAGSLFGGWLVATPGKPVFTYKTSIDFEMESDLQVTADFETNIYPGAAGVYNGIFDVSNDVSEVTETTAGMVSGLRIGSNGVYNGKVWYDGVARNISGVMDAYGKATNLVSGRSAVAKVEMSLNYSNSLPEVDGLVTGTNAHIPWAATLLAERAAPLPPGQYTVLIPLATNSPQDSPGGDSYLSLTNREGTDKNPGAVIIAGALADGTTFSETTAASTSGDVPLYANLYNHAGLLLGWINLNVTNSDSDGVVWIHPAVTHGLYRAGFTNIIVSNVLFSPWTNFQGDLSGLTNISDLTNLFATDTEYETNLPDTNDIVIDSNFHIVNTTTATPVKGLLQPKTGLFTLTIGSGSDKTKGYGAILMNANEGDGYFLTTSNAQAIILQP
jgi:Leucine-rich repeat (LRR) protein